MPVMRDIVSINQELCNGCGRCVLDCAEGAIAIVNGKATVISDSYCDGLGACLSGCPQNALTIIQREAVPFDEEAAMQHVALQKEAARAQASQTLFGKQGSLHKASCPSAQAQVLTTTPAAPASFASTNATALGQRAAALFTPTPKTWPMKLRLMPATAAFLKKANIFLAADCAAAASAQFHSWAQGKVIIIACPKFEDKDEIRERLRTLFDEAQPRSVEVVRMEVPCCQSLVRLCEEARTQCKQDFPLTAWTMSCSGERLG